MLQAIPAGMKTGCKIDSLKAPIVQTDYASASLPASFGRIVSPILLGHNDKYGSCVETCMLNIARIFFLRNGKKDTLNDNMAIDLYGRIVPSFDPNNPLTDNGTDPEVALDYWMVNVIGNTILKDWSRINHKNLFAQENAIVKTGAVMNIWQLTQEQMQQNPWYPTPDAPIEGGHCTCGAGFAGTFQDQLTWGMAVFASDEFSVSSQMIGSYELELGFA